AKVHSVYTHIELPTKRKAIRALEAWVHDQLQQLKEEHDASTKAERTQGQSAGEIRAETVEKEKPRRNRLGTGRQAESRDCGDRGGVESQEAATRQVRRGEEALRVGVGENESPTAKPAPLPDS